MIEVFFFCVCDDFVDGLVYVEPDINILFCDDTRLLISKFKIHNIEGSK